MFLSVHSYFGLLACTDTISSGVLCYTVLSLTISSCILGVSTNLIGAFAYFTFILDEEVEQQHMNAFSLFGFVGSFNIYLLFIINLY